MQRESYSHFVKQDLFNWSKASSIHRCGKGLEAKISGLQVQDSFH